MAKEFNIPEEYVLAFNRLMRRMPVEFREDETIRKTALVYLKVGGEKLAVAGIKALTTPFSEKFVLRKMQLNDVGPVNETDSNSDETTGADSEETLKDESADTKDAEPVPTS